MPWQALSSNTKQFSLPFYWIPTRIVTLTVLNSANSIFFIINGFKSSHLKLCNYPSVEKKKKKSMKLYMHSSSTEYW